MLFKKHSYTSLVVVFFCVWNLTTCFKDSYKILQHQTPHQTNGWVTIQWPTQLIASAKVTSLHKISFSHIHFLWLWCTYFDWQCWKTKWICALSCASVIKFWCTWEIWRVLKKLENFVLNYALSNSYTSFLLSKHLICITMWWCMMFIWKYNILIQFCRCRY